MHQIEDKRLEECRKFLVAPGPVKSREELLEIVRDLTWAVEELQLRRLQERTRLTPEKDERPYLLFGSDEAVLKFVETQVDTTQSGVDWKQANEETLRNVLPRSVRARKLDGADEKLWQDWEELCRTYESSPEVRA
jgi:hypothetical protein